VSKSPNPGSPSSLGIKQRHLPPCSISDRVAQGWAVPSLPIVTIKPSLKYLQFSFLVTRLLSITYPERPIWLRLSN